MVTAALTVRHTATAALTVRRMDWAAFTARRMDRPTAHRTVTAAPTLTATAVATAPRLTAMGLARRTVTHPATEHLMATAPPPPSAPASGLPLGYPPRIAPASGGPLSALCVFIGGEAY